MNGSLKRKIITSRALDCEQFLTESSRSRDANPTDCEITQIRKLPENNAGFFCQTCKRLLNLKTALREDQTNILLTENS